jgi:hypothetical protein
MAKMGLILMALLSPSLGHFLVNDIFNPDGSIAGLKEAQNLGDMQKRASVPAGYTAAPYYPTPKGGWVSTWTDAYVKAKLVVANMTLAEKVNMTTGTGLYMVC